ncbi:hypothetical protein D9757_010512 [Collybiopsis confluens]|uniref:RING-type domain-containing protein n=1 Tax=Collybiopsis confluens TaxID=2823264 RepID=A0A8H5LSU1_9AGAR|nr:hypothetical protein D9757_010512 [Collybiopsis confluens]
MATPLGNVDRISALLIAQLSLDEIGQLEQPNEPGHPISDEDYALRLMAEEFARVLAATDEDDDENIFAWPVMYNEVLPESTDSNGSSTEDSESDSIEDHLQYTSQSSDEECAESELVSLKTCAVCREDLVEDIVFTLRSCGHHYCGMCLEQCIETCIETESMFPPKCCDQNMAFAHSLGSSTENLAQFLDDKRLGRKSNLGNRLRNKAIEFGVPPEHRDPLVGHHLISARVAPSSSVFCAKAQLIRTPSSVPSQLKKNFWKRSSGNLLNRNGGKVAQDVRR